VVALLFVSLLIGMFFSALIFGWLLTDFSQLRLIKVVQGAAVVTVVLNILALWKQETRNPNLQSTDTARPSFSRALWELTEDSRTKRLLIAVALGTAGFTMQDVLLEPFGGEILGLSVSSTTVLTAILAGSTLVAFALAARFLGSGMDPHRLAGYGALIGIFAFAVVTIVSALQSVLVFRIGVGMIGFGAGLFSVGTLSAAMAIATRDDSGFVLGAWGAVQATSMGLGVAVGGALRDVVSDMASSGALGPALLGPSTGYGFVYQVEILLLFATLIVVGPLARHAVPADEVPGDRFGLSEFPG
jgi:BCD family chlorophyll transporter-like MFS transporter